MKIRQTDAFAKWLKKLKDHEARGRVDHIAVRRVKENAAERYCDGKDIEEGYLNIASATSQRGNLLEDGK